MAAFRDDPTEWERLDWRLLQNGAIVLYHRPEILAADLAWLAGVGYRIVDVDCRDWAASGTPHQSLARALNFPSYYGANLNALADVLSDLDVAEEGGLVIVLHRLDAYVAATDRGEAQVLLEVFEDASRRFLLTGRRLLVLVQSNEPRLAFEPVGARPVLWNPREWANASRIPQAP